jgi:hypothetical protein
MLCIKKSIAPSRKRDGTSAGQLDVAVLCFRRAERHGITLIFLSFFTPQLIAYLTYEKQLASGPHVRYLEHSLRANSCKGLVAP